MEDNPPDQTEELDLNTLSDEELVEQMHDDLYDGLKEEIEEGTNILLEREWSASKVLDDALVEGMNQITPDAPLDLASIQAQVEARDAQMDNPFAKDAQVIAIRQARQYRGDKLVRTAKPHRILDPEAGPLIAVRLNILTRKSLATPIPLACVAIAQAGNEILDRLHYGSWRWPDTLGDTANTLFWPTILFIGLRMRSPRSRR